MENNIDLIQSLNVIKNVANKASWFGEHGHRWPLAALPMAYAMACVEIVSKNSERASVIYREIIEARLNLRPRSHQPNPPILLTIGRTLGCLIQLYYNQTSGKEVLSIIPQKYSYVH